MRKSERIARQGDQFYAAISPHIKVVLKSSQESGEGKMLKYPS